MNSNILPHDPTTCIYCARKAQESSEPLEVQKHIHVFDSIHGYYVHMFGLAGGYQLNKRLVLRCWCGERREYSAEVA